MGTGVYTKTCIYNLCITRSAHETQEIFAELQGLTHTQLCCLSLLRAVPKLMKKSYILLYHTSCDYLESVTIHGNRNDRVGVVHPSEMVLRGVVVASVAVGTLRTRIQVAGVLLP